MFTGIVEELGEIVGKEDLADAARFVIRGPLVTSDAGHGDSIAVNGVCLTVVDVLPDGAFTADTFNSRNDRHLSWFAMELDERGWTEAGTVLAEAFASLGRIRGEAKARLQDSTEARLIATASILFFESPQLWQGVGLSEEPA